MILYIIYMNGKYLQGIEPNEHYSRTGTAPTMGARHTPAEYKTVWGFKIKAFEPLTATNYIKCIFEEFRWKDRKPADIKVMPVDSDILKEEK